MFPYNDVFISWSELGNDFSSLCTLDGMDTPTVHFKISFEVTIIGKKYGHFLLVESVNEFPNIRYDSLGSVTFERASHEII
jgi:hypothetical protein